MIELRSEKEIEERTHVDVQEEHVNPHELAIFLASQNRRPEQSCLDDGGATAGLQVGEEHHRMRHEIRIQFIAIDRNIG